MTHDVAPVVHRPVHDRPTLVSYASLSTWSWFVYGFGASLALLRDDQGTSAWIGGLHGSALAAGGIIGAIVTPRLNHRVGRGPVARAAVIGTAAIGFIAAGRRAPAEWAAASAEELKRYETPPGLLRVAILSDVRKLLAMAAPSN